MDAPATPSGHQEDPSLRNFALEEVHEMLPDVISAEDLDKVENAWPRLRDMQPHSPGLVLHAYWRQCSHLIAKLSRDQIYLYSDIIHTLDELVVPP